MSSVQLLFLVGGRPEVIMPREAQALFAGKSGQGALSDAELASDAGLCNYIDS